MSTIATAYVQVLPSTKGIKSALTSEFNGVGTDAGRTMGSNLTSGLLSTIKGASFIAAGAAIGAALIKGVSSAVSEGGNLQQSIGGIETLFKDSANKVMQNAANAWKTAGMSANEYMENVTGFAAGLISSLGGNTRKAAEVADQAMQDMSDNANKMGTDMAAIQNAYQGFAKQNYTMLDNLKLGYGGTKKEMERLLQDATKLSGVRYNIDNLADVYNAIHEIQKELGITGTTAKEAATTLTGSFNSVKGALKNVLGELALGSDVSDSLEGLGEAFDNFFNGNLIPMISNVFKQIPKLLGDMLAKGLSGDGLSKTTSNIAKLAGDIVTGLVGGLLKIGAAMPLIVMKIIEGLSDALPQIILGIGKMIEDLAKELPRFAPMIVKELPKLIGAIITGLIQCIPALIQAVGDIIAAMIQSIPQFLSGMADAFRAVVPMIADSFRPLGSQIMSVIRPIANEIGTVFSPVTSRIAMAFSTLAPSISNLFQQIGNFARSCVDLVVAVFQPISERIGGVFRNVVNAIKNAFQPVISFMGQVVERMISAFQAKINQFRQMGQMLVNALRQGLEAGFQAVVDSIRNRIDQIASFFQNLASRIQSITRQITSSLSSINTSGLDKLTSTTRFYSSAPVASSFYSAAPSANSFNSPQPVNVNVTLSGSAKNIFDSVRVENTKMVTATSYKALA